MRGAVRLAGVAGALALCAGCYTYVPTSTAPAAGSEVSVIMTDRGRVALNERVGPGIDQLRGLLTSSTDSSVTLSMKETVSLRGVSAYWSNEPITLMREHFGSLRLKHLSRGRTAAVAAGFGAALAAVVLSSSLLGSSSDAPPVTPPGVVPPASKISALSIPFRSNF